LDLVYGRNSVLACINGKREIKEVLISKTMGDQKIINLCKNKNITYKLVSNNDLNKITFNKNHQGVCCYIESFKYKTIEELISKTKNSISSIVVMLDGIEDPVNFGSIIRTSSCFNVDGIIISKNRQVQLTSTVSKIATGAEEFIDIIQVTNLNQTIDILKKNNYWIVASDGKGNTDFDEINYSGKICLIVGSEGKGISQLVLKNSDFITKIPISGPITSLNAAISCAIFLAQITSYKKKN